MSKIRPMGLIDIIEVTGTLWDSSHDWHIGTDGNSLLRKDNQVERKEVITWVLKKCTFVLRSRTKWKVDLLKVSGLREKERIAGKISW